MNNPTAKEFFEILKENDEILGAILFGSWARGNNRLDSDIDLIVIQRNGFKRVVETFKGLEFEITYTTESAAKSFWNDNPDDCIDLWSTGIVLFDKDGTINRLQAFASDLKMTGKKPLTPDATQHLQFDVTDQLKGITALISKDPTTALLLLNTQVVSICNLFFDLNQLWTPAPKQLISSLEKYNPNLAIKVREFYTPNSELVTKLKLVHEMAQIVFSKE